MKAMILAAGLGQRMRPLTDHLPKPLLCVGGKPLLQYHLENLRHNHITEIVINLAYLGHKIREFVGDGSRFSVTVSYSDEPEPLETAGAILHAMPLLGKAPFLLINGDVWSDFPLQQFSQHRLSAPQKAHLVLVPNPDFHPLGDFAITPQGLLCDKPDAKKYTFAGVSLIAPQLITQYPQCRRKFPLGEVLRYGISQQQISAEVYAGLWSDVGTPERLDVLNRQIFANLNDS